MDPEVAGFAQIYQRFLEAMRRAAGEEGRSPVRELVDEHLGVESVGLPVITESFASYDHVNVQIALTRYLESEGRRHKLIGLTGQQRHYGSLSDLLETAHIMGVRVGAPDLVNLPVGPDEARACVQFGLFLIDDRGTKVAAMMRGPSEHNQNPGVTLEVLCPDADYAREFLSEVRRLSMELSVFRRQVIAFGEVHMGRWGLGPVVFLNRPNVSRGELVLAPGVLELVERQMLGVAAQRDRLRASSQHVKRGLLLHGPPGTGKTLTVRYLMAAARDHTVLLLTGGALNFVRSAVGLARVLQPAIVVLEDVDLVAHERGPAPWQSNPVLFDLLNVMDGIDEDADVAFILTTNRADLLEPALAARPGRVDTAIEIRLPDDDARRRLIQLFGRGLDLRLSDLDAVVSRTAGVAASFIKEMMRKSALLSAIASDGDGRITVTDANLSAALDEMLDERSTLNRILLGGGGESRPDQLGRHSGPSF